MKPGIYTNDQLSNEDYHAGPGVSSTTLKELINRSPAHCKALMDGARKKSSDAITLGTIIHEAVLEPETFDARFAVAPNKADYPDALDSVADYLAAAERYAVTVKKSAKKAELRAALEAAGAPVQFWDDLKEPPAGKQIVTPLQMETARGVAASVAADPDASFFLSGGVAEQSFFWIDRRTGELCKARTDYYVQAAGRIVDVKSCEDARPQAAARAIANYGYDISAAMYMEGVAECGLPAREFVWVFVESAAPYAVRCYVATPALLERARAKWRDGLDMFAACRENDHWPGYPAGVVEIDLPAWALESREVV